jgi:hypothetical protein
MTPILLRTTPLCLATLCVPLLAGLALPNPASAQTRLAQSAQTQQRTQPRAVPPVFDDEDELSPRQMQAAPAARSDPAGAPIRSVATARSRPAMAAAPTAPAAAPAAPRQAQPAGRSIACSGAFARDSNHLKLAIAFDSRNLAFTEVDGPEGTKLNASVLFPNDPKRRLEVLWQNEPTRSDTSLIVIGGQSQWTAPKGLRIGTPLAAVEKANGRPFKLAGLDQGNGGTVIDWDGGALNSLPGGCAIGIRLAADPKTPDPARAAAAGKELASNDPALKGVKMSIVEIILGYSQ